MTPRFRVNCRPTSRGWLGSVELDEGKYTTAIGLSKAAVLAELQRMVVRKTAMPKGSFELFEGTSDHPKGRTSVFPGGSRYPSKPPGSVRRASNRSDRRDAPLFGWVGALFPSLFRDREDISH